MATATLKKPKVKPKTKAKAKEKITTKDRARRMIERLPDDVTWEDIQYHVSVCQAIERGMDDIENGRFHRLEDVIEELGLDE